MSGQKSATHEQWDAIQSNALRLVIRAFAGTGKTATALSFTAHRPHTRFLYTVFNKSAEIEAKKRFSGGNVTVVTSHGLAYRAVGRLFKHKLVPRLHLADIRNAIDPFNEMNAATLMMVRDIVSAFLVSSRPELSEKDVLAVTRTATRHQVDGLIDCARQLWEAMKDPDNLDAGITHDGYLKLYQLQQPDLSERFDHIIVDEAQDLNPVTAALMTRQLIPVTLIGDEHQAIYRFRGAINALARFKADEVLSLTESFRFGVRIATLANSILMHYKGEDDCLIGCGPDTQITYDRPPANEAFTKIHRTFAETFASAFVAFCAGKKVAWVGGVNAYPLQDVLDLYYLYKGQRQHIKNWRLTRDFGSYENYREAAKHTDDFEMLRLIRVVEDYDTQVPTIIAQMQNQSCEADDADIIVTTAHRAKGLQWANVVIANDFPDWHKSDWEPQELNDEINLIYVAITRAEHCLTLSREQEFKLMNPPAGMSFAA